MKEEDKNLMGIMDEVPFHCEIEDSFVLGMLSIDFVSMVQISKDVIRCLNNLDPREYFLGGVCNSSEEIFYEVNVYKRDMDNVVVKSISFVDIEKYLDHIKDNNTVKYFSTTNESLQ